MESPLEFPLQSGQLTHYVKSKVTQNTSDKLDTAMQEARNQMPWACENRALVQLEKKKKAVKEKLNPDQVVT